MEQTPVLAQRWALLVDPAAAHSVIERISKLELPRRICRPLDRGSKPTANAELRQFDAAIEAAVEAEASSEWAEIEDSFEDEAEGDEDWAAAEAYDDAEMESDRGWAIFEPALSRT